MSRTFPAIALLLLTACARSPGTSRNDAGVQGPGYFFAYRTELKDVHPPVGDGPIRGGCLGASTSVLEPFGATSPELSPDGWKLAFVAPDQDAHVYDRRTGIDSLVAADAKLLSWSPDSSLLPIETVDFDRKSYDIISFMAQAEDGRWMPRFAISDTDFTYVYPDSVWANVASEIRFSSLLRDGSFRTYVARAPAWTPEEWLPDYLLFDYRPPHALVGNSHSGMELLDVDRNVVVRALDLDSARWSPSGAHILAVDRKTLDLLLLSGAGDLVRDLGRTASHFSWIPGTEDLLMAVGDRIVAMNAADPGTERAVDQVEATEVVLDISVAQADDCPAF